MGVWENQKQPIYNKWKEYWFKTHPEEVAIYTWEYLFTGGKEIRARLLCELWRYLSPDSDVQAELAFAVECIHVASLILDDSPWMDNASHRRGKKTLHLQFSNRKALLLCHDVMKMVYQIWISHCPPSMDMHSWETIMRDALERLTIGQYYDMEKKGSLLELASLKTGVLFGLVGEIVGHSVGLDPIFWREWGNRLGILFQWMDDWHDQEEDEIQGNRNAFNEHREATIQSYVIIWTELCKSIGPEWFRTPFGVYVTTYFTSVPFPFETIPPFTTLTSFPVFLPICTRFQLPTPVYLYDTVEKNQKLHPLHLPISPSVALMETLVKWARSNERFETLQTNLWNLPEQEWEHDPEVQHLLDRVQVDPDLFTL